MPGTLSPEEKKDWKAHVPAVVHAYNCTKNAGTGYSPYYLLYGREPGLPIDIEVWFQKDNKKVSPSKPYFVEQLRRLKYAHRRAKQLASKQQESDKGLYDQRCGGAELEEGDYLVLVRQTALKGTHKIQDKWEDEEFQVVSQPTSGIPAYKV